MEIFVDEIQVKKRCSEIHFIVREMEQCMNDMDWLIKSLNSDWKGEAEIAYDNKLYGIRSHYKKTLTFFDSYATVVEEMMNKYEAIENEYSIKISNV